MKQCTSIFAGIDVSKAHLDVYLHPTGACRCFDNDKAGWRSLCRWLTDAHPQGVVYEATGSYHKGVERYLGEHGFPIARLDPRRARRFAEALGVNAKTSIPAKIDRLFPFHWPERIPGDKPRMTSKGQRSR